MPQEAHRPESSCMKPTHNGACCDGCREHGESCHALIVDLKDIVQKHVSKEDKDVGILIGKVGVILKVMLIGGSLAVGMVLALVGFALAMIP